MSSFVTLDTMDQKVILNIAISLDGYVANLDDGIDWLESYDDLSEYGFDEFIAGIGAIVMGKRSYDIGVKSGWFEGKPYGPSSVFVVCEEKPLTVPSPDLGDFVFIESGIEATYEAARHAAGEKNIYLFGGPSIVQQSLNLGLVDEMQLSIVPVLLGKGISLFANLEERRIQLERTDIKPFSKGLTAIHYRVIK